MRFALLCLLALTGLAQAHRVLPGYASARAGESVTLRLSVLAQPGYLINKTAPTVFTLETPFGPPLKATLEAAYPRSLDPDFPDYHGLLKPLVVALEVPANAKPGRHVLRFRTLARYCAKTQHLCVADPLEVPFVLEVGGAPRASVAALALVGLGGTSGVR